MLSTSLYEEAGGGVASGAVGTELVVPLGGGGGVVVLDTGDPLDGDLLDGDPFEGDPLDGDTVDGDPPGDGLEL